MLVALLTGLVFGAVMQAGLTWRCDCALDGTPWRRSALPRAMLVAVGLGIILIYSAHAVGLVQFHVKPFYPVGIALGGVVFGIGVAILGFCPGTLPIGLAGFRGDALAGLIGGLVSGTLFTAVLAAHYEASPWHGPTLAAERLGPALGLGGGAELALAYAIGVALILLASRIGRRDPVSR
jgi:hypothetical protein